MSAIRVKTHVPEDRVVTLKLPPEVPVGDVEFDLTLSQPEEVREFEVVLPPDNRPREFPKRPTEPQLAVEHDRFLALLPSLLQTHRDKYVAILDGQVLCSADGEVEALTRAHEIAPGRTVLVRRVTDQPQPIPRITSRRALRAGE